MRLFIGLGNPGDKYARNRHNAGFLAVDRIAVLHGFGPWRKKFQGQIAEGLIGTEKVLLLKPETFMNESGRSVGEAARFLKISPGDIVVFYDEIDLVPGKLKVKTGGGNAGHNGLRSISAHLDNDYVRVRIGIGHPGHKDQVANWVLNDFAKADQVWLEPLLQAIADAAGRMATGDHERFLTDVANSLDGDDPAATKPVPEPDKPKRDKPEAPAPGRNASASRAAGDRQSKRQSALAENLRKWMEGRKKD